MLYAVHLINCGLKMKGKQANSSILKSPTYLELRGLHKQLLATDSELDNEQVHNIRVLCKRVRAEALLLKSKKQRAGLKKLSKMLARYLAPARDAQVRIETFDLLVAGKDVSLGELRSALVGDLDGINIDSGKVIGLLDSLLVRCKVLRAEVEGVKRKSLAKAQQKSLKLYQKLSHTHKSTYHDWRKSVKSFLYLLKLLPEGKRSKEYKLVKQLADKLGLLHDLHVFEEFVVSNYRDYLAGLRCLLDQREQKLLQEIDALSVELYG